MRRHLLKGPTWSILGMPSFVANSRHNFAFNVQFLSFGSTDIYNANFICISVIISSNIILHAQKTLSKDKPDLRSTLHVVQNAKSHASHPALWVHD